MEQYWFTKIISLYPFANWIANGIKNQENVFKHFGRGFVNCAFVSTFVFYNVMNNETVLRILLYHIFVN